MTTGGVPAPVPEVCHSTYLHRRAFAQISLHTSGTKVHIEDIVVPDVGCRAGAEERRRRPRLCSPGVAESVRAEVAGCWGHLSVVTEGTVRSKLSI